MPISNHLENDDISSRHSRVTLIGFSLGSLGTGIFSMAPSVLLLYFMTDILGIAASLAAVAMALPRFWDIFVDPLVGIASDRTRSRWGRRRPYLLVGAVLMSVSFIFLFSVPDIASPTARFLYVLIIFVISSTAYSVFSVPYITMPAEMSDDPRERTRIMSYRIGFALGGLLIGATAAPLLVEWFGGGRAGYSKMSIIIGAFCGLSMLTVFFVSKGIALRGHAPETTSLALNLRLAMTNRPFFILVVTYILQISAISTFLAAVPYSVVYLSSGSAGDAGVIFLALMSAAIMATPVWSWAAIRFGKKPCYLSAILLYSVVSLVMALRIDAGLNWLPFGFAFLLGVPFGAIMMIPFSMLTDTIQFDTGMTGLRREGIFTGLWMAGEKAGLAIGPLIMGTILSFTGFMPSLDGATVQQSRNALLGIQLALSLVPAIIMLSSVAVLRFYSITEDMLLPQTSEPSAC